MFPSSRPVHAVRNICVNNDDEHWKYVSSGNKDQISPSAMQASFLSQGRLLGHEILSLFTPWMTDSRFDLAQASVSKHISIALVNDLSELTLGIRTEGKILSHCSGMSLMYFSSCVWQGVSDQGGEGCVHQCTDDVRLCSGCDVTLAHVRCVGMIHRSSPLPFITSRPNPQLSETVSPKLFKRVSVQQTQIRNQTLSLLEVFTPGVYRRVLLHVPATAAPAAPREAWALGAAGGTQPTVICIITKNPIISFC